MVEIYGQINILLYYLSNNNISIDCLNKFAVEILSYLQQRKKIQNARKFIDTN